MQMRPLTFLAALLLSGVANAQMGGMGDAMQRIGENMQNYAAQRELLELQHKQDMERMRLQQQQEINQQRQQQQQTQKAAQVERVMETAHPGWRKTVNSPVFAEWMSKQPRSVKNLADSDRAEDAILMLDLFKRDTSNR